MNIRYPTHQKTVDIRHIKEQSISDTSNNSRYPITQRTRRNFASQNSEGVSLFDTSKTVCRINFKNSRYSTLQKQPSIDTSKNGRYSTFQKQSLFNISKTAVTLNFKGQPLYFTLKKSRYSTLQKNSLYAILRRTSMIRFLRTVDKQHFGNGC